MRIYIYSYIGILGLVCSALLKISSALPSKLVYGWLAKNMLLETKIQNDLKEAMKSKDMFLVGVLRMVATAIKNKKLEKRAKLAKSEPLEKLDELSQLDENETIAVLSSEVKKRKDAIEEFIKGGRLELADREKKEIEILKKYLPEQMPEEEIRKIVVEVISNLGAISIKEIGKVMAVVMPQVKGKADGALVQKIVQEELGMKQ